MFDNGRRRIWGEKLHRLREAVAEVEWPGNLPL